MAERIGHVTLKEYEPGRWQIRYKDPRTGKDFRMRLGAGTFAEAVADAERHNRYCRGEVDTPPHLQVKQKAAAAALCVKSAMTAAEAGLNYGADALRNYRNDAARFVEYATEHRITRWKHVTRDFIRQYYAHMKSCDLAHDTIRLRLLPVRITSRHWALESAEYSDEYMRAQIKHKRPSGYEPDIQFLTMKQTQALLAWLKENAPPRFFAMAMIGFHTGARQLEIVSLRPCDIDSKSKTITFVDTEQHRLKTAQSKRTVPVPQAVLDAITEWPVDSEQPLFLTVGGTRYDACKLAKEWRRYVLTRACQKIKLPEWFTASVMRPTFATLGGQSGVNEIYLQRMMGHAPQTTLRKHYRAIEVSELAESMANFWQLLNSLARKKSKINAL